MNGARAACPPPVLSQQRQIARPPLIGATMARRRVVLTGNSGWTTRVAANSSRFVPGNSTATPSSRVTKTPSPAKQEKQRARLETLRTEMRAARKDGNDEVIPGLWRQAKSHLGNLHGAKAAQLPIYQEMHSYFIWAGARKKARKNGVSFGTANPRRGSVAPNPLRLDQTDVRQGHCIHDLAINQCAYCFPSTARNSSTRSTRQTSR
jgi:hypothetical protein